MEVNVLLQKKENINLIGFKINQYYIEIYHEKLCNINNFIK